MANNKYHFRVYDGEDLVLQALVPSDEVFGWIDRFKDEGIVKCYLVKESEED